MNSSSNEVAACLDPSKTKHAALFFDSVLLYPTKYAPDIVVTESGKLLSPNGREFLKGPRNYANLLAPEHLSRLKRIDTVELLNLDTHNFIRHRNSDKYHREQILLESYAKLLGVTIGHFVDSQFDACEAQSSSYMSVVASGIPTIDTNCLEWEQIFAIRKDPDAKFALRDFRNFMYENYTDRPFAYVEESLSRKMEVYENTAKAWGLRTIESTLELVLSSKNASAIAGFSSVLFGAPLSAAILAGATATLANVGFHVRKRQAEKLHFLNSDPIRYLVKVNDLTQG